MKLRIRGNSIRLRLMQGEVKDLLVSGELIEKVDLLTGEFGYALKTGSDYYAEFSNGFLMVTLPVSVAQSWEESEHLGIDHFFDLPNGKKLRLLIEKDLECLTVRDHEDESDAFPNPKKSC